MEKFLEKAKGMYLTMKEFLTTEGSNDLEASSTKPTSIDGKMYIINVQGNWSSGDSFYYEVRDSSRQVVDSGNYKFNPIK